MASHQASPQMSHTPQNANERLDIDLRRSSDGVDMDRDCPILTSETVYEGAIFTVEDRLIALPRVDGTRMTIRRQVLRHPPAVVMLVHDGPTDRYVIEREYRAGPACFTYGLPAGLLDPGEDVEEAALRELAEETGIVPDPLTVRIEPVADCYSSEGMTDELAHIMVVHLNGWHSSATHFDADEHVESAWVTWNDLLEAHIQASNSVIAIQHEQMRRMRR